MALPSVNMAKRDEPEFRLAATACDKFACSKNDVADRDKTPAAVNAAHDASAGDRSASRDEADTAPASRDVDMKAGESTDARKSGVR